MAQDKEVFLSRWSRLKTEKREAPKEPDRGSDASGPGSEGAGRASGADALPAAVLPPVEKLTPESDFAPFMQSRVGDALRRAALKKLFSDPHFNVPDPNEAYSGDWTDGGTLGSEILAKLDRARAQLSGGKEAAPAGAPDETRAAGEEAPQAQESNPQNAVKPQTEERPQEDGTGKQDA